MSNRTTAIPRYRRFDGPAVFRQGFRPFFLGAGVWAVCALILWIGMLHGAVVLPGVPNPVAWHAHEMIFGYAVAAIAGFLLTAIPNWTGRMPLQGLPLIGLFGLWLAGRVAMLIAGNIGPGLAALLDLSFLAVLIGAVLREIVSGRNWRNLPMPVALAGLLAANVLTHLQILDLAGTGPLGQRLGIAIVILLISLVGGRIVPSFTRNWLVKRGVETLPATAGRFDQAALVISLLALASWVAGVHGPVTGSLLLVAGLVNFVRLARWCGHRTLGEPLVWSLHLGFAWVPTGFCLLGLGIVAPYWVPPSAGLHALGAGAIGSMTLAVMTRAILGHTGRTLVADGWTHAIYLFIAAAAAVRVAAPFMPDTYSALLVVSAVFWSGAFGLFAVRYGAILLAR